MHFAVYILAGKYRLVPDLNMLSISLAIFCVQIFFLVAPLAQRFQLLDSVFCAIIGILLHYCILSSFTWSSVIAYDITKSVLSLEHPSFATVTYSHYIRYSLFAWLTAGIPVVTGLTFDATMPDSDYSPVYGR
jgi:ABC-type enterochelin transport system permease subunit